MKNIRPILSEFLDPEKYLQLTEEDKSNIEKTIIIPAELGENHFGKIEVIYRFPVWK